MKDVLGRYSNLSPKTTPLPALLDEEKEENIQVSDIRAAQTIVGELLWASCRTRPDLSFAVAWLGRNVSKCPRRVLTYSRHTLGYLLNTPELCLKYGKCEGGFGEDNSLAFPRSMRRSTVMPLWVPTASEDIRASSPCMGVLRCSGTLACSLSQFSQRPSQSWLGTVMVWCWASQYPPLWKFWRRTRWPCLETRFFTEIAFQGSSCWSPQTVHGGQGTFGFAAMCYGSGCSGGSGRADMYLGASWQLIFSRNQSLRLRPGRSSTSLWDWWMELQRRKSTWKGRGELWWLQGRGSHCSSCSWDGVEMLPSF